MKPNNTSNAPKGQYDLILLIVMLLIFIMSGLNFVLWYITLIAFIIIVVLSIRLIKLKILKNKIHAAIVEVYKSEPYNKLNTYEKYLEIDLYDKLNNELKIVIDIKSGITYEHNNEGKLCRLYDVPLKEGAERELKYKLSLILRCNFELIILYSNYYDTYLS